MHLTRDGKRLVYTSDEDGEFSQLMTMDLTTGRRRVLTKDIPWNVEGVVMRGEDGVGDDRRKGREFAALAINVAGRYELRVIDLASGREVAVPGLPTAARSGSISRLRFAKSGLADEIAFTVNSAQSPGDIYAVDLQAGGAAEQWTRTTVDGVDTTSFREAEIVKWKSFDGLEISGLINRAPARFPGKRPVLINIHGGPESQATIGFLGRNNYFIDELGIAYIQPNVRGSSGYGKTFIALDDGMKREDSVKDIGALLDWVATQPDLDASRIMVTGGSYGGYMSLAVATTYPDRIAASIDVVGISNFTSFLERTETYRRDLRRIEYGDERDPRDAGVLRAHLAAVQGGEHQEAAVRRAGSQRPARAVPGGRPDRREGPRQRHPGVVSPRRQRRPRVRAEAECRLSVLRPDPVHAAVPAAVGSPSPGERRAGKRCMLVGPVMRGRHRCRN